MMRLMTVLLVATLVLLILAGCAGPNEMVDTPDAEGKVAGFWQGLWNGFSSPFTFIISLFTDSVFVYDVHNSGNWYNFGFLLGASIIFGGGGGGAARRRR
ncbi:MAG: hypothetical protein P8X64_05790 [Anaerolineales bacterium]